MNNQPPPVRKPMNPVEWLCYCLSLPFGPGTYRRGFRLPDFISPEQAEREAGRTRPPRDGLGGHVKDKR